MAISDGRNKWWHIEFAIKDSSNSELLSYSTVNITDPSKSNVSNLPLVAYNFNCSSINNNEFPVRSFSVDGLENLSPGFFLFRPESSELDSLKVSVSSINDVLNINNRYTYEYRIIPAYNSDSADPVCEQTALIIGTYPDSIDNSGVITVENRDTAFIFEFPELEQFESVGCCNIDTTVITNPLPDPGDIEECTRLWGIKINGTDRELISYDIGSNSFTSRGEIISTSNIIFPDIYDIAWDNRDYLWALSKTGIKRLLQGSSLDSAFLLNDAIVFKDPAFPDLFPLPDGIPLGSLGMCFNQYNGKMYLSARNRLWEFTYINDNAWVITKVSFELFSEGDLPDFAFDEFGECFTIVNGNLVKIDYTSEIYSGFGQITSLGQNNSLSDVTGIDFMPSSSFEDLLDLYAVKLDGSILLLNKSNGNIISEENNYSSSIMGVSGCQPGEDTRTFPFPFFPGEAPWVFMLDTSGSMSGVKIEKLKEAFVEFFGNFVRFGDEISFVNFGDIVNIFGPLVLQTEEDASDALEFVNNISTDGKTRFCYAFDIIANGTIFRNIKNIIVITDGAFSDCGLNNTSVDDVISNTISPIWENIKLNNPDVVMRTVGIDLSTDKARELLGKLGNDLGGGGFTEWITSSF